LIWLEADTLIRERSAGKRSLDDFARLFFGVDKPYVFEDVVEALSTVEPYDWAAFLRARLEGHGPGAPLGGITRGGYRLIYSETQSDYQRQANASRQREDFSFSLGFAVGSDGALASVSWNGPAFKAGLAVGDQLVAVNGVAYDADRLKAAVAAAKDGVTRADLLVRNGDEYRALVIDYHGGLRYPALEKLGAGRASLDDILTPR
jgi:predicted metalloprotease with PDZ domain